MKFALIISILFSLTAWSDPGLGLIGAKERLTSCQNQIRKGFSFSPNELILSIKSFKDVGCKQLVEINRYKMTCEFSHSDDLAICKHTGRARSVDGNNWDTLPVELDDKVQVKAKSLGGGKVKVHIAQGDGTLSLDILELAH